MKSIQERVRATLAKQAAEREAAQYKAGESKRRSVAGRYAAAVRSENRLKAVLDGRAAPSTRREHEALERLELGE